ncbi:LysE family transporter (plasmid) [Methylobacterium sp. NMS14P]|uniref:LysE family translocator n=1 Tax=unclassified Methylobacterium TaxID=2615210 RepID=UPI0023588593|nr:LysE family transporter [Methylobacterium sp. NMS14P]WCS28541.1 LysE family transporter [Methylobacterium sp. NMS14P]
MNVIATALLTGASLGLSIAAPIGPTSLLCVQRTLSGGLSTGLATGLGVATVHLTYGSLIMRWGADLAEVWSNGAVLSLISGAVLLALAVRVLISVSVLHERSECRDTLAVSYGSAVVLAVANPVTPVLFLAAMPAFLERGTAPFPVLAAGVFFGSFGWWVVLNTAVSLFRRCVTSQVLNQMNKAAGVLLVLLALSLLVRGLDGAAADRSNSASMSGVSGADGRAPGSPAGRHRTSGRR